MEVDLSLEFFVAIITLNAPPALNSCSVSSCWSWGLICWKAFLNVSLYFQFLVFPVPQCVSLDALASAAEMWLHVLGVLQPGGVGPGVCLLSKPALVLNVPYVPWSQGAVSPGVLLLVPVAANLCLVHCEFLCWTSFPAFPRKWVLGCYRILDPGI